VKHGCALNENYVLMTTYMKLRKHGFLEAKLCSITASMILNGSMIFQRKYFVTVTTYIRLTGTVEVLRHKKASFCPKSRLVLCWYKSYVCEAFETGSTIISKQGINSILI
jgi:hypothetical protein